MPRLELYPFRYGDPRTGKGVSTRYRAERHEIAARHAEWEIIGPAEIRDVDPEARAFTPHQPFKQVMDAELRPLAERLVYRNRERSLKVDIRPNRERYAPGEEVSLTVRTTDPDGVPVPAELSLSVVDDALLAFADDDEHALMSGVLLQADLPDPIEGAADWFDPASEDGGLALDLALGTRGWRRFEWTAVVGFRRRLRLPTDRRRNVVDARMSPYRNLGVVSPRYVAPAADWPSNHRRRRLHVVSRARLGPAS